MQLKESARNPIVTKTTNDMRIDILPLLLLKKCLRMLVILERMLGGVAREEVFQFSKQ